MRNVRFDLAFGVHDESLLWVLNEAWNRKRWLLSNVFFLLLVFFFWDVRVSCFVGVGVGVDVGVVQMR